MLPYFFTSKFIEFWSADTLIVCFSTRKGLVPSTGPCVPCLTVKGFGSFHNFTVKVVCNNLLGGWGRRWGFGSHGGFCWLHLNHRFGVALFPRGDDGLKGFGGKVFMTLH